MCLSAFVATDSYKRIFFLYLCYLMSWLSLCVAAALVVLRMHQHLEPVRGNAAAMLPVSENISSLGDFSWSLEVGWLSLDIFRHQLLFLLKNEVGLVQTVTI